MRILAALIFVTVGCVQAFSCTCLGPSQAKTMREVADWYLSRPDAVLIVEGKVLKQEIQSGSIGAPSTAMSMTAWGRHRVVNLAVIRTLRGPTQNQISVLTGLGDGDCGYDFQTGQTYLVYASKGEGGAWFTSLCSGTNRSEDAGAAIRILTGEKPTAEDLLPPQQYWKRHYEQVIRKRTGSVCGLVLRPDGSPLKGAQVELWELRDDGLPSRSASDPNTSTGAGRFCIEQAEPGYYLLTVDGDDFDHDARYMSFYPGVSSRKQAAELKIEPGVRLPDVKLITFHESLYTIHIRVVTPDGTVLSYKNGCGVQVDSVYGDPLSYHIESALEGDGSYTFGYIPAGEYVITTYFQPNLDTGTPFPEASRWRPARREVIVRGDTEVVLHVELAKPN